MSWLKFDTNTPEKPEVLAITIELGWDDPDLTVGKLLKVWRWFDEHSIDGNAKSVTLPLLDRIIGVTGITQAMINVGWLEALDGGGLSICNFENHNGATAKARALAAKRASSHRGKSISNGDSVTFGVTTALPREEKRREEKILKTKEQRGSRLASDWVLLKSWGDWATNERPDLDIRRTADDFRDYWHSVAGAKGVKLDWQATWRVWVRGQRVVATKLADVARQTVPSSGEHEKTKETMAKTFEGAKPPTLEQLALLASIRGSK
jgi:hypothetical protein